MALTLGEKVRQAREARGITISEVAEQTRISSLYLEGIEENDYRTLPGGIFNKGFVKTYAKYVGLDEQEALQDYALLIDSQDSLAESDSNAYRPEVLTDDRNSSSIITTIIFAVIILGLMTWGIMALIPYLQESGSVEVAASPTPTPTVTPVNSQSNTNQTSNLNSPPPVTGEMKIELKAVDDEVSVTYKADGDTASKSISPDESLSLEVESNVLISYSKYRSANIQLSINGKQITLPVEPENSSRQAIEVLITRDNVGQILQDGKITFTDTAAEKTESNSQ